MMNKNIFVACDTSSLKEIKKIINDTKTNKQKARISRNPKTGEKVNTPEKATIHFKMAKEMFKKLNNEG